MRPRSPQRSRQPRSITMRMLWTTARPDHRARCALVPVNDQWELRVHMDGTLLLQRRCTRTGEAFALAEEWKRRLLARGWIQTGLPQSDLPCS